MLCMVFPILHETGFDIHSIHPCTCRSGTTLRFTRPRYQWTLSGALLCVLRAFCVCAVSDCKACSKIHNLHETKTIRMKCSRNDIFRQSSQAPVDFKLLLFMAKTTVALEVASKHCTLVGFAHYTSAGFVVIH